MAMSYTDTVVVQASEASHLITSSPHQPAYHECTHSNVSLVHDTPLVHPSFRLARRNTPVSSPIPSRPMSCRSTSPLPSARLPDEIFAHIAQYVLGNAFDGIDVSNPSLDYRKPAFSDIDGMTRASRRLRAISLSEWFRLFIVSDTNDWNLASRLNGMYTWVRHIICPVDALVLSPSGSCSPTPMDVLARFPYLRSASLALARDYQLNLTPTCSGGIYPSAPAACEILAGFEYCFPVSSFPPTMTSISVRSTHGSETPLLRNLSAQCPDLRVLRLAKCTMFDSCTKDSGAQRGEQPSSNQYRQIADGSGCVFWATFPHDHDIYFGSENTEAYANELAAELAPLQNLEEVSVGVYLTPLGALAEHRLAHYPLRHLRDDDPLIQNMITAAAPDQSQPPILLPLQPPTSEQPYQPAAASSPSSYVVPTHAPAPPITTLTPWSTSEVTPPPYMDSPLWSYDCLACRKLYAGPTAAAERMAGLILADTLPHLKKIEWASFFESRTNSDKDSCGTGYQRGTGTHEWRVLRDSCGVVVNVERVYH